MVWARGCGKLMPDDGAWFGIGRYIGLIVPRIPNDGTAVNEVLVS